MSTRGMQYDISKPIKPSKVELEMEGEFWKLIREELLLTAEGECSDPFYKLLESKINSMGPEALKRLYIEVNKG